MSRQTQVPLDFEGEALEGVLVGRRDSQARPTVILIPTVMGVSDLEIGFGTQLVELGYNAFVADIFGKKFRGSPRDVMFGELNRLKSDRAALRRRLLAILDQVRGLGEVESGSIVVAGYCFRRNVRFGRRAKRRGYRRRGRLPRPVRSAGSPAREDHRQGRRLSRLGRSDGPTRKSGRARPGADGGGRDWQIHAYGHVAHGFTNPNAHEIGLEGVRYNALAAERSWTSFINLLEELFSGHE